MANRILTLSQQRGAVIKEAADLLEAAAKQNRSLTGEEQVTYDALFKSASDFKTTIDNELRQAELESTVNEQRDQQRREGQASGDTTADEARQAFTSYIREGFGGVRPEQRQHLVRANQNALDFRASEHRSGLAQSELTGNIGGYLVPQGFWNNVIAALKFAGGMDASGATVINTSMGNQLPIPTSNDTGTMATELGESSPASVQEVPFGQVILNAYKYTSHIVQIPIELLQDSGVDIEAFITNALVQRFARARNNRFTVGSGSGRPRGIVLDAVAGKTGANGQGTGLVYADLIDLKYSVNRAYRAKGKWMMNDNTLKTVLKIVDDNHRPLILDYLNTLAAGEPESILGQPLINNDDMPELGNDGASPATGYKAILYGDFSAYWIRNVMAMMLMRLTERYAEMGQVGFIAFMRWDGKMVDAGTNPVKAYVSPSV